MSWFRRCASKNQDYLENWPRFVCFLLALLSMSIVILWIKKKQYFHPKLGKKTCLTDWRRSKNRESTRISAIFERPSLREAALSTYLGFDLRWTTLKNHDFCVSDYRSKCKFQESQRKRKRGMSEDGRLLRPPKLNYAMIGTVSTQSMLRSRLLRRRSHPSKTNTEHGIRFSKFSDVWH